MARSRSESDYPKPELITEHGERSILLLGGVGQNAERMWPLGRALADLGYRVAVVDRVETPDPGPRRQNGQRIQRYHAAKINHAKHAIDYLREKRGIQGPFTLAGTSQGAIVAIRAGRMLPADVDMAIGLNPPLAKPGRLALPVRFMGEMYLKRKREVEGSRHQGNQVVRSFIDGPIHFLRNSTEIATSYLAADVKELAFGGTKVALGLSRRDIVFPPRRHERALLREGLTTPEGVCIGGLTVFYLGEEEPQRRGMREAWGTHDHSSLYPENTAARVHQAIEQLQQT